MSVVRVCVKFIPGIARQAPKPERVSVSEAGQASQAGPRDAGGTAPATPAAVLLRLVWRLMVAQAIAAGAVGLPFGRRHATSVLITLSIVTACCLAALLARAGTRAAWAGTLGFELAFFLFGLAKFVASRYVGGTLFALIISITLMHPAVARAYGALPWRLPGPGGGGAALGDAPEGAYGEQAAR